MKQVYIIEHLEPKLGRWVLIEYKHISKIIGKRNLWFTNIKHRSKKLERLGKCFSQSVKDMKLEKACILDPEAKQLLTPSESKRFNYFIFGGILGDYPPKKRTKKELTNQLNFKAKARNIGKKQMSTDNAIYTVSQIAKGKKFKDLEFKYNLSLKMNKYLTLELPYLYNIVKGKPLISKELVTFLKRKKGL
ncbi:MAG: SAM-dependent methyltransferase [Nanoarchaeota archaeon]